MWKGEMQMNLLDMTKTMTFPWQNGQIWCTQDKTWVKVWKKNKGEKAEKRSGKISYGGESVVKSTFPEQFHGSALEFFPFNLWTDSKLQDKTTEGLSPPEESTRMDSQVDITDRVKYEHMKRYRKNSLCSWKFRSHQRNQYLKEEIIRHCLVLSYYKTQ